VDASEGERDRKIGIVDTVLADIGCTQPRLLVCNKVDLPDGEAYPPGSVSVSALEGTGMAELKTRILESLPSLSVGSR